MAAAQCLLYRWRQSQQPEAADPRPAGHGRRQRLSPRDAATTRLGWNRAAFLGRGDCHVSIEPRGARTVVTAVSSLCNCGPPIWQLALSYPDHRESASPVSGWRPTSIMCQLNNAPRWSVLAVERKTPFLPCRRWFAKAGRRLSPRPCSPGKRWFAQAGHRLLFLTHHRHVQSTAGLTHNARRMRGRCL